MRSQGWRACIGLAVFAASAVAGVRALAVDNSWPPSQTLPLPEVDTSAPSYVGPLPAPKTSPPPSMVVTQASTYNYLGGDPTPSHACEDCVGGFFDNIEIWSVGDGFRNVGDVIPAPGGTAPVQANFGMRTAINSSFALGCSNIRGQVGGSFGVYDFQGRDTAFGFPLVDNSAQGQAFFTAGIYRRSNISDNDPFALGLVYDQFWANNWGVLGQSPSLGQIRGLMSYALNDSNAIGFTLAGSVYRDETILAFGGFGQPIFGVRTTNYGNFFWTHNYSLGGETTLFIGGVDSTQLGDTMFGVTGRAPLSQRAAIYANFTYVAPFSGPGPAGNSDETWNVSAGMIFYFGRKAVSPDVSGQQGLPLLPVADNSTLMVSP